MKPGQLINQDIPLDIVGSTVFGRYPKISLEQTFNMIISDDWLVPFAGYQKVATISSGGVGRALYNSSIFNHLIAVVNEGVFIIDNDFGVARVGTIDNSVGTVYIAENNNREIAISSGKSIFIFNYQNNTFQKVASLGFLPGYISFQDTYFIAASIGTNNWILSGNNDGMSWPNGASNVSTLQTKPDTVVATVPFPGKGNLLLVFGETVTEFWYDVGSALFPYQRSTFTNVNYGCLSAETIATENGIVVWLAANEQSGPVIMFTTGGEPEKISNDGIDFKLASLTNPSNSFAFLFRQDGHLFYQITFPDDNLTYAYDFNTKKFFTLTDEHMNYHIAKRVAFFNDNYYFVSFQDGNLYQLSSQLQTYDGHTIPRVRVCKTVRLPDNSTFRISKVELITEQGQSEGLQAIDFSFSKDGGRTFSSYARKDFNDFAVRRNRLRYWGLGMCNEFIPQFRFWGDSRFVLSNGVTSIYQ